MKINEELPARANDVFQHGCKATIHVDPKATQELDRLVEEGPVELANSFQTVPFQKTCLRCVKHTNK